MSIKVVLIKKLCAKKFRLKWCLAVAILKHTLKRMLPYFERLPSPTNQISSQNLHRDDDYIEYDSEHSDMILMK